MLGSLAMSLAGGLASSLGDKAGEWLGLTPDARNSPGMQGMQAGIDQTIQAGPGLTQAGMFNQAGQTGAQVQHGFGTALDSLQPSAKALQRSSIMQSLADKSMSNANTQTSLAQNMASQQMGATRRDAMNALRSSGAGPSAIAASLSQLGGGAQQGAAGLLAQASQAQSQGIQQAGGLTGQAQGMLGRDLALRNQVYVDPYKAQVQNMTGLAGQMAGMGAESATQARTNPLAGIAQGLGQFGGGMGMEWLSRLGGDSSETVAPPPGGQNGGGQQLGAEMQSIQNKYY